MQILGNRFVGERVKLETSHPDSAIILPQILQDDNNTGGPKEWRVLQVGPGRKAKDGTAMPIEFSAGDRVICHSYTTGAVCIEPGKFIIEADMVIAVIPRK